MIYFSQYLTLLFLHSTFITAQLLPLFNGKTSLPILQDPAFNLRPAEVILQSQLRALGVKINLDLDVDIKLDLLGLDLLKRGKRSRGERSLLGLNLNLGLGSVGSGKSDKVGLDLGVGDASKLDTSSGIGGINLIANSGRDWGQADNVRGERGGSAWFTYITVGDPPQAIPVVPDTGSADLFIYASSCSNCHLSNHSSFNHKSSRSYSNVSKTWSVDYHDETGARGYIGKDTVNFGASGLISTPLAFALATKLTGVGNGDSAASGIMGLSLDDLSTMPDNEYNQGATLFSRLVKKKQLDEKVLGIRMDKGQGSQGVMWKEGGGMYSFGGVEERYIVGGKAGLNWIPVTSQLYWGFSLDDITIGTKSMIGANDTTKGRVIIDTGTTLIITSTEIATAVHSQISGSVVSKTSGIYYIPCTTFFPQTQNIFFKLGGQRYGVPIADLAWKKSDYLEGMCISGVQGGVPRFTVLGDVFIKNHYIALAYSDDKLGQPKVGISRRPDVGVVL